MKQDYFSSNNIKYIDYKDLELLRKFIAANARMMGRKKTNTTSKNQRKLSVAIKRSRFMGLLPFIAK